MRHQHSIRARVLWWPGADRCAASKIMFGCIARDTSVMFNNTDGEKKKNESKERQNAIDYKQKHFKEAASDGRAKWLNARL